ncbi:M16 family metallopeptidase [Zunongwangia pacifica]|uniref:Insulinase family protein n=1 Tax=Zunongwangia pacifica TaxID=2911062 RepID=A0A9X1ZTS6_9FLAO|nr:M16 family metallopeptidase [Zunongwangia pacifica]MCL6220897.1 insulinase family protein [Zunongwangia pacifica]
MIFRIKNSLALLLALLSFSLHAQQLDKPIMPKDFASGMLNNGMHYFVLHNEEPKERASFYFAQNVGSVLENDSQRGLAHFLEHMAFNGTQNFKDKEMLEFLERNGMKFGSEINAFTSFDETVYNINQVPVTQEKVLDSVLLILHDWSGYLSLTDEEIDNERGVINEEWRTRNTAGFRANSKIWTEGYMADSKYGDRMPIGLMEIINNFDYKELRDYYSRWYRPDQQAVIVVGDIDVKQMEAKIKQVFGSIPLKKDLPERPVFDLPITDDFVYIKATDKELGEPSLQYFVKRTPQELGLTEGMKADLTANLASYILNNRFSELILEENSPVLGVSFGVSEFIRPLEILNLSARPKKDSLLSALGFMVREYERFAQYGATEGELKRAKAAFKTNIESASSNIAKRSNDSYAGEIYQDFFKGLPVVDYRWSLDYQLQVVEELTNQSIIDLLSRFEGNKGRGVGITGNDTNTYPSEQEIEDTLNAVNAEELTVFVEEGSDKQLINTDLAGSKILKTAPVEGIDAKQYTLANGLKLVLYPTDFDKEQVFMSAFSPGGSSQLSEAELPNTIIASYLVSQSGLGDLNKIELQKLLAGTETSLGVAINAYSETLSGNSKTQDLETLFKQIYLQFTAPRFDEQAYAIIKQNLETNLIAKEKRVTSAFQDSLALASTGHSKRSILFDQALIDAVSLEGATQVYKDRISNASDFTFVFVGDFKDDQLLELAKKYLGSIPGTQNQESVINHQMHPQPGKTPVHLNQAMETPQATISVSFSGPMEYTKENNLKLYVIAQLLDKRYMERIREEEGGSYGVSTSGSVGSLPEGNFDLSVGFNCNPDKADDLLEIVYAELEKMKTTIDLEELAEIKRNYEKQISENQRNNGYWLSNITANLERGQAISDEAGNIARMNAINPEELKETVKKITKNPAIIEGLLMPED